MSDFNVKLKSILNRSAKFIGRAANTTAKAAKYKVNEISALNKRRELIVDLGKKVFDLCGNGLILPEEANAIVEQINQIDAELDILRADHAAEKAAAAEQHAMEKAARASEKAAAKSSDVVTAPVEMDVLEQEHSCETAEEKPVAPTLEVDTDQTVIEGTDNDIPTLNV